MSRKKLVASTFSIAALAALLAFAPARSPQAAPPAPPQGAPQAQVPGGPPGGAPPPTWLVTLDLGPKWDATKPPQEQPGFAEHFATINKLVADGTLLVGGPLLENFATHKITGAIWVVKAEDEEGVKKLLAGDPWSNGDKMKVASIRAFFPAGGAWLGGKLPAPPAK